MEIKATTFLIASVHGSHYESPCFRFIFSPRPVGNVLRDLFFGTGCSNYCASVVRANLSSLTRPDQASYFGFGGWEWILYGLML